MKIQEWFEEYKVKRANWLYDHMWAKKGSDYVISFILCTISAVIFAFGFSCFMDLGSFASSQAVVNSGINAQKIVGGGVSGIGQVIVLFIEVIYEAIHGFGTSAGFINESLAYSILYFVLNVPICILGWIGIGKRFTIFTLINIAETSLLLHLMTCDKIPAMGDIAIFVGENGGLLSRALIGGVCTGLSAAICFKIDASTGGIDVIAYYIALKKRTLVGKYSFILNGVTLVFFTILSISKDKAFAEHFAGAFYSGLYLLISKLVVDTINIRNKKVKLEIVSSRPNLGEFLIESVPHGATMQIGTGVYTGKERYIFSMVVSSYELAHLLKLLKKEDSSAFVSIIPLSNVSGRFYTKPIR